MRCAGYVRRVGRAPRAFAAGEYYHVGARGNNGEAIVRDDIDRIDFLRWYARIAHRARWRALAYVLMDNHYHFVIRCGESGLSAGVQQLNCGFARRINCRHGRTGHLFRQRFYGGWIKSDDHLREVCRYVVLNPVRAGLCGRPEDWAWSSHRACVDAELAPDFLAVSELLELFDARPGPARAAYETFVAAGRRLVSDTVTQV